MTNESKHTPMLGVAKGAYEIIEIIAATVAVVLSLTMFLFRHSVVVGPSMDETLHDGEHLLISDLFYTPKTYDIVVFDDLSIDDRSKGESSPLIKRVIATEGQHVVITKTAVLVDGEAVRDDFVYTDNNPSYTYGYQEFYVPEGKIFVMGDHRNDSLDSRGFGFVDERAVLGKVLFRLMPFTIYN